MATKSPPMFSILLFSAFILSSSLAPAIAGKCNKDDKKALVAIKLAHFNDAYHFSSWTNTSSCCDWYGVGCSPYSGRVSELYVQQDNLVGTLPSAIGDLPFLSLLGFHKLPNLTGSIPESITKLRNLTVLDLSWNSLSGPIPSFLSSLTDLAVLDLSFNLFSGAIPPSLSSLPNLIALHLDRNHLSGPIPSSFSSFSSSLDLYLSHNHLSGPIPPSLASSPFDQIDFSRNNLTGDASFFFSSSNPLTRIDLSRNQLSFDFSKVNFPANLSLLDLNHNMIFGSIPAEFNMLTGLNDFNVSYNRLCGQIPQGTVTAKFDEFSYFHNKCLCGPPLAACK